MINNLSHIETQTTQKQYTIVTFWLKKDNLSIYLTNINLLVSDSFFSCLC